MGNGYSSRNTNLGINCPCFESGATGSSARWENSLDVSMGNQEEGQTEIWSVGYKVGKKLENGCELLLRARHDNKSTMVLRVYILA